MLEQHTIANLLDWMDNKRLVVNREYQRSSRVWPTPARAYLIDTILRGYPVPKIYLRTKINSATRQSYWEVVDGQQRLEGIRAYANDEFPLGNKLEMYQEFAGLKYSALDEDSKQGFLQYPVAVEQLMNVPDSVVFDVFRRLNTYNYNLSQQELRHGKYHGAFRSAVSEVSQRLDYLWSNYPVLGKRARIRMADDELVAQMFGVILEGVTDGGQRQIEKLYRNYDARLASNIAKTVDSVAWYILENLAVVLETELARAPHFLMLFAAVAHARHGIPSGDIGEDMPVRDSSSLSDIFSALSNLSMLADVLELDSAEVPDRLGEFRAASSGSTQRIRSRRIRFPMLYRALSPTAI
jgi:hypothetical protein